MKVAGVIAEYNPFHNGHLHHLEKTREIADAVVCVISGAFLQRGEPAVIDKWARAEAAVKCGADLVLELPFPFSASPAEIFAFGGVDLLNKIGIINFLSFGSESGDIKKIIETANILIENGNSISKKIKDSAGSGKSYAMAVAEAVGEISSDNTLDNPNNLLGVKYVSALKKLNSDIVPFTVKREGNFNSTSLEGEFVSAAAIRNEMENSDKIKKHMPEDSYEILCREIKNGKVYDISGVDTLLCGILRRGEDLSKYAYVAEGIENRFKYAGEKYTTYNDIIDYVKTKRYTRTRLARIAAAFLTGLSKQTLLSNMQCGLQYARVLGIGEKGGQLLKNMKDKSMVPIISRGAEYLQYNETLKNQFELEMRAGNIASLCAKTVVSANSDLLKNPFVL